MSPSLTELHSYLRVNNAAARARRRDRMPDIAKGDNELRGRLDRVGMGHIELPVRVETPDGVMLVPARADAFVDLADPDAKGIHMSRLFLRLQEALERAPLSGALIVEVLEDMRESHADLSTSAFIELRFDFMSKRPALISDNEGWRTYPVVFRGDLTPAGVRLYLGTTVTYSSTCPCSAALARQLIQEAFDRDFGGQGQVSFDQVRAWLGTPEGICATPHSQRSEAEVIVQVSSPQGAPSLGELITNLEEALRTPVQAAVKREDEQAFALLNGQNNMFCEDAARRLKDTLDADARVSDYRVECRHFESLHPHDAVSVVTKGVEGGLQG